MKERLPCPACGSKVTAPENDDTEGGVCPRCGAALPQIPATAGEPIPLPMPSTEKPPTKPPQVAPVQFGRPRKKDSDDDMDMTPMVDVTFLLLIFFMVTAAFSLQRSFQVPAPNPDQPSTNTKSLDDEMNDEDTITVRIDSYNTYRVITHEMDREAPSEQELMVYLREAKSNTPRATTLMVVAHGDAFHEKVVTALDAGTALGMTELKMVTVEEDD